MYDKDLALEILGQIYGATQTILRRFQPIKSPADFLSSDAGLEKLDAICMKLIAIGESLKNIDKVTNKSLLPNYPQVEWRKVKGMRDIISHHYFDLNAESIYEVCRNEVKVLAQTIKLIMNDIK